MQKVLIANRGEIAVRIIRACHELGLQTVAVYSQADAEALHVLLADEAICIGEAPSAKSYLKVPAILSACEVTGADAVHPGYGFLSENAHFASYCESSGITFIGPSASNIEVLGDKAKAKATAKKAKCPIIPGSDGVITDIEAAEKEAGRIGYPVFIKAVAGGGGRGIRIAHEPADFRRLFIAARTEAEACFGNPEVYLEKMVVNPRHIEVQVMADKHGHCVHLGERDCTIQRRRQKLIEESPSPLLTPKQRKLICEAAVNVAKTAKYTSAGTVEFLVDEAGKFYFMEMNTRIQVEHTVTEELTQIDLVKEMINVSQGHPLSVRQKDIQFKGHVIQLRINAEDSANGFMPSPGKVDYFMQPGGPNVRMDTACYSGYFFPPYYDSLLAKLIVRGTTRKEAIATLRRALREFHVGGVKTTVPFHQYMLEDPIFLKGTDYNLNYIDDKIDEGCTFVLEEDD